VQSTRIGLAFRSSISHELEGKGKWVIPDHPLNFTQMVATNQGFTDGADISAEVDLPETVSLALHHSLNDKLAVVADATWTNWSRLDEIRIVYESPQSDTVLDLQWDDTWRYSVGLIYKATDKCTGRFGIAFDETPIPDKAHRTPRIPGEDRLWVAIGAGYKFTEKLDFNFGYTHIFTDDPKIDKTGTAETATLGTMVGEWEASVDIVSVNVTYVF
jgi:long-chain fatty acid transport protein